VPSSCICGTAWEDYAAPVGRLSWWCDGYSWVEHEYVCEPCMRTRAIELLLEGYRVDVTWYAPA
jgi:hypothetical protein